MKKKHHKITVPERDQIAWRLASGITIREMAQKPITQLSDPLEIFTSFETD
jgi:hypothetical protein